MIYFDNSASTFYKPESVINAVANTMRFVSANPGRSGHTLAMRAARIVMSAREKTAAYLGLSDSSRIVFTDNCTGALNAAILGTVKRGGNVITTEYEHNSVLRPLFELKKRGDISLTILPVDRRGFLSASAVENALRRETYLIITNHVSNVTGTVTPVDAIGKIARKNGILYIVDGAQSVGYCDIDMESQFIDVLCAAPHKGLHGPQGVGILAVGERAQIKPVRFGGTGTQSHMLEQPLDLPESLETGTLPTPAIAGLGAAIKWSVGSSLKNRQNLYSLSRYIIENLKKTEGVTLYTPENIYNGIIAFNVGDLSSQNAADILSENYDICVRPGLHCAPLIHRRLGTLERGAIRASLGCDNTEGEAEFFIKAVREIAK